MTVSLEVASIDETTGKPDTIHLDGLVEALDGGTWRATFTPAPAVVGCLYGALSGAPDFAATPPTVRVGYTFRAYLPASGPFVPSGPFAPPGRRRWLDQVAVSAAMQRRSSPSRSSRSRSSPQSQQPARLVAMPLHRIGTADRLDRVTLERPPGPFRRPLPEPPLLRLVETVAGRAATVPFVAPCGSSPEAYVEDATDGRHIVGCVDWTQLGRLTSPAWFEVTELAQPGVLRVFRSNREAGLFLVLPASYRVARDLLAPTSPCATWLTSSEASTELGNQAVFSCQLAPALDAWQWSGVQAAIEGLRGGARVCLPTDAMLSVDVQWRGVQGIGAAEATVQGAGLVATVTVPLADAPIVREAIARGAVGAALSFRLSDTVTVPSTLELDLDTLAGPWPDGPVACSVAEGVATIANRTGSPVRVTALRTWAGTGPTPAETSVDLTVGAGSTSSVPVPAGTTSAVVRAVLTPSETEAAEVRTYLDDLHTILSLQVGRAVWDSGEVTEVSGTVTLVGGGGAELSYTQNSEPTLHVALTRPLVRSAADTSFLIRLALHTEGSAGARDLTRSSST